MSPRLATRRRAEEFEAIVEGRAPGGATPTVHDDLLELVGALRAVPQPTPRADFVADLRARLVAEAATLPAAAAEVDRLRLVGRSGDPGRVRNPRERRVTLALGGLALVGATTTMAVVAQTALPGETLYPLKRGIESAHTGLTFGEGAKGRILLANASTRLDEVGQLARDNGDTVAIEDTMNDFTEQATQASDLLIASYDADGNAASITEVRDFTATSMRSLASLQGEVPPDVEDEWVHAVTTLVRIDDSARQSCPTCGGTDLSTITPTLPTVGTGFGTLPAVVLPPEPVVTPTGPVLPSIGASDLPPGSVTKPTPTTGGSAGPSGLPTTQPTGLPTTVDTTGLPTAVATTPSTALPTINPTQLLSQLTAGPTIAVPLPTTGVSELLGGVGSILPTPIISPLATLLP